MKRGASLRPSERRSVPDPTSPEVRQRRNVASSSTGMRPSLCGPKSRRWSGSRAGGAKMGLSWVEMGDLRLRPEELAEQKLEKKLRQARLDCGPTSTHTFEN